MKEEQLKNVSNLISASLDQDKEIMKLNNTIIDLHSVICEKQNEINRLNNIINELENYMKEERINNGQIDEWTIMEIQMKLQELKEGK